MYNFCCPFFLLCTIIYQKFVFMTEAEWKGKESSANCSESSKAASAEAIAQCSRDTAQIGRTRNSTKRTWAARCRTGENS